MAEITSVLPIANPYNTPTAVVLPTAKSSLKNDQKKSTEQRTDQAAKKAFKEFECWKKFCSLMRIVGHWIKAIPTKIADALNRCLSLEDDSDDEIEDGDEEVPEASPKDYPKSKNLGETAGLSLSQEKVESEGKAPVANASRVPAKFFNKNNNCWFHATLQFFWAMGEEFHRMVHEKDQAHERASLAEEYQREKQNYENQKSNYNQRMAEYDQKMKKVIAYEKALKKYQEEDYPAYEKEMNKQLQAREHEIAEYEKTYIKYKNDLKKWENSGQSKNRPKEPPEPKKIILKEPKRPATVNVPSKPNLSLQPVDPICLIEALKSLSAAMKTGNGQQIRRAADKLQKVTTVFFKGEGGQEDPDEFLVKILTFLAKPFFKIKIVNEGTSEPNSVSLQSIVVQDEYILKLLFKENMTNFQDILNDNFKQSPPIYDPNNPPYITDPIHLKKVPVTTSKESIVDDLNPPNFFIVRLNRNYGTKNKITTCIDFPPDNKINFAKAFGIENPDEVNYKYELKATVIHLGESSQGGHYVANVCGIDGNEQETWYSTNDLGGQVKSISAKDALNGIEESAGNKDGYLFFFKRVMPEPVQEG